MFYNGPGDVGMRVCQAVAARATANEARVIADLAASARETQVGSARVREVEVTHMLQTAAAGRSGFHTLSPYAGCVIGCRFCYGQEGMSGMRRLLGLAPAPWGTFVDVLDTSPRVLEEELARIRPELV